MNGTTALDGAFTGRDLDLVQNRLKRYRTLYGHIPIKRKYKIQSVDFKILMEKRGCNLAPESSSVTKSCNKNPPFSIMIN